VIIRTFIKQFNLFEDKGVLVLLLKETAAVLLQLLSSLVVVVVFLDLFFDLGLQSLKLKS
jgi:hypothetical protein